MKINTKIVTAPITNDVMDVDLHSKTIYIFDYDNSELKNNDFFNYIDNIGIIGDILFSNTSYEERSLILERYLNSKHFNHFTSLNIAILNCIFKIKKSDLRLKSSALTEDMETLFANSHKDILNKWISFYDSYLMFMIMYATNNGSDIKSKYKQEQITNESDLSPNMVSLLLDEFFYDYYRTGINDCNIKYWKYFYENKLYDGKPFHLIMLNDSNYFVRILKDTAQTDLWKKWLK